MDPCRGRVQYAAFAELIASSPCTSFSKKQLFANEHLGPRKRVLTHDECVALWRVTDQLEYPEAHFYRWLLLTGCRLSEASGALWPEFNLDRKVWRVPAERFKGDEENVVPLTDPMCAVLKSIPRNGPWVFTYDGKSAMNGSAKLKVKTEGLMGDAITAPWVKHDLRRTVRTNLSALGVADHVAEMVLGHGRKGIQRVYDRHRYLEEIRSALTAWNPCLAELAD